MVHARRAPLIAAASLLLVTAISAVVGRPPTAHADASIPTWPPPTVPAQQSALTLDCPADGIDLNHATLAELQQLPGVAAPIAQRIVATRPHDRVEDLLVVPGIGPGKLADIQASGRACSTPLTLPPPAADACTSPGQLDVNNPASQAGLAELFGGPTAARLVAGQPYPDLSHATVVLAAGAGPGKVGKYTSRLCATPVPKIHAGVQYTWIYSVAGGRNDYAGATLVVPPGVLSDPVGSWSSVAPQPVDTLTSGPRFDITIHGPWSDGTKRVYVALPPDSFTPPAGSGDWVPTILHGEQGSQEVHAKQAVATTPDGRVATTVTHLSPLESLLQPASNFAFLAPVVVLPKSDVLDNVVDNKVKESSDPAECAPDVSGRTDAVVVDADSATLLTGRGLLRAPVHACVEGDLRANQVTVKLTNTSGIAYQINPEYGNAADMIAATYQPDVGVVTRFLLDRANAGVRPGADSANPRYGKGTVLQISVPLGAPASHYEFDYDPVLTAAVFLTDKLSEIPRIGTVVGFLDCLSSMYYGDLSAKSVINCAKVAATKAPQAREILEGVARAIDVYNVSRDLFDVVIASLTRLGVGTTHLSGDVSVRYSATKPPVIDAAGRFVPAQCFVPDGALWKVDESCYQAWLVNQPAPPADCATNPQCQPQSNPGSPPDTSGCWTYDQLAGAWVLNATAGQGCLLLQPGQVFCGVGPCVPWPDASNRVVEVSDGRSFFIDARGGLWHLATTDAYFSCVNKFSLFPNPGSADGKWLPDNLNNYKFQGDRYGC